ncbi:recombinase family protein [Candidatus Moduliflexota bacterium]
MGPSRNRKCLSSEQGKSAAPLALIYTRVSSKDQEKEGFSIPAQQKLLRDYAHAHGLRVAKEFSDIETAKRAGRTDFNRMIAFLKVVRHVELFDKPSHGSLY